jgi:putative protease
MAIGTTTGVVEFKAGDIRVEFEPVVEAPKGCRCSIKSPEKLRRGDKVYLWEEVERIMQ